VAAPVTTPRSGSLRRKGGSKADPIFRGLLIVAASSVLLILAAMILRTSWQAWPVLAKEGLIGWLTGDEWSPGQSRSEVTGTYGAWPFIYGTLKISFVAILFAIPISVGIALYVTEVAPKWLRGPLAQTVDMLAMVPSVVYALVGLYFFREAFFAPVGRFIASTPLGNLQMFSEPVLLSSYWSAANILAIMIIPIITAICRETFRQVPAEQRHAAYAMGATRWEVMRKVVVPYGFSGVVGGSMLGLGRALGETMAVAYLIGSTAHWAPQLFFGGDAMTAVIVNTFAEAAPEQIWALLAMGVTLFFITIIVNMGARLVVARVGRITGAVG